MDIDSRATSIDSIAKDPRREFDGQFSECIYIPGVVGSDRLVAALRQDGRTRGWGEGGIGGRPLRVRVLPYMVKKAGIGRGCPTLIGRAATWWGIKTNNASVHIIHGGPIVGYTLCSVLEFGGLSRQCLAALIRNLYI